MQKMGNSKIEKQNYTKIENTKIQKCKVEI